jgi:hypothetical protein
MAQDVISVERLIAAPAGDIFPYLADATRHRDIDGSGTVREAKGDPEPLQQGSKFGMSMKMGVPYSMVNTVIEFEQDRRIAWQTHGPTALGRFVGGRIWRYELEPAEGGTLVRETWDITQESPISRFSTRRMANMTKRNMEKTLARIDELVTS